MSSPNTARTPSGVLQRLTHAIQKGRLAHAILFLHEASCEQAAFAVAADLAKILFCENPPKASGGFCGQCRSCLQTAKGAHPDFSVLEPQEDSATLKIEEVRQWIQRAHFKPFWASSKVFVIRRSERLTVESQNALLKILEEPESGTYFILLSSAPDRLLPTLRSRTQAFHLLSAAAQRPALTGESQNAADSVVRYVTGEGPRPHDFAAIGRQGVSEILERAVESLRDALCLRLGQPQMALSEIYGGFKRAAAQRWGEEALMERIELLAEFKESVSESANVRLALSLLWDRCDLHA